MACWRHSRAGGSLESQGWQVTDEQRELMRIAAQRVIDDTRVGRKVAPDVMAWAKAWAAIKPLGRPLGTGEPVPDEQLPPALRGGALEVF